MKPDPERNSGKASERPEGATHVFREQLIADEVGDKKSG